MKKTLLFVTFATLSIPFTMGCGGNEGTTFIEPTDSAAVEARLQQKSQEMEQSETAKRRPGA